VCTVAAFLVFFELVHEVGPSRMVVVTYANTAIAVLLGVAVLSEPLTRGIVLGFPLILIGSFLATSRKRPLSEASRPGTPSPRRSFWRASRPALPR
jgi:drug/metabolite transporter (DMT)-like permease